jgi:hypothetical protein
MEDNKVQEITFQSSTIETVDFAVYNWLNEKMNIHSNTHEGWKKVPVIWTSAERSHQIKNNKDIRDSSGMLLYPLISLERVSVNKDPQKRGSIPANIRNVNDEKGGTITIARTIQQEKTSNFENATFKKLVGASDDVKRSIERNRRNANNNVGLFDLRDPRTISGNKTVYETITIPIPIHVTVTYNIFIKCDYLQQMNEILAPFLTKNGNTRSIILNHENHRFEAFMNGDITQENNFSNLSEERKTYGSKITLEVLGKLIGGDTNEDKPKIVRRENAVEFKFPREHVILQDEIDGLDSNKNKRHYR